MLSSFIKQGVGRLLLAVAVMAVSWKVASYYNQRFVQSLIAPYTQGQIKKNTQIHRTNLIYLQLANALYYFIILIGLSIAFSIVGISNTIFLAVLGTFGLAISLSMQKYLTALVAGAVISVNQLFNIGDHVTIVNSVTNRSQSGTVLNFDLLRTTMLTDAGPIVSIPNDEITSEEISVDYVITTTDKETAA